MGNHDSLDKIISKFLELELSRQISTDCSNSLSRHIFARSYNSLGTFLLQMMYCILIERTPSFDQVYPLFEFTALAAKQPVGMRIFFFQVCFCYESCSAARAVNSNKG